MDLVSRVTKAQAQRLGLRLDDPVGLRAEVHDILAALVDLEKEVPWRDLVGRAGSDATWGEPYVQLLLSYDDDTILDLALRLIELRTFR